MTWGNFLLGAIFSLLAHGVVAFSVLNLSAAGSTAALPFAEGGSVISVSLIEEADTNTDFDRLVAVAPPGNELKNHKMGHIKPVKKLRSVHASRAGTAGAQPAAEGVVSAASLRGFILPEYPEEAREKGQEGQVIYELTVGPLGNTHAELVRSSGYRVLDAAALSALERAGKLLENSTSTVIKKRVGFTFKLQ